MIGLLGRHQRYAHQCTGAPAAFAPRCASGGGGGAKVAIDDLLVEEPLRERAAKAVANVLLLHNSELRGLYDKYWCVTSPSGT